MWPSGEEPTVGGARSSSGSEVVIIDNRMTEPPVPSTSDAPVISKLNVSKSSKFHIGNKFVSVTNNVQSNEVVKGKCFCLELVSPAHGKRLRCSVAVFVCWALIVACGLAIYLAFFILSEQPALIDLGINATWYLKRPQWQAIEVHNNKFLKLPVKQAIIGHSATPSCDSNYSCKLIVKAIQMDHIERYGDIGPNFIVGGDGLIFEGRGGNVVPAMVRGFNSKIIGIMFLGNYAADDKPNDEQIENVKVLLKALVAKGVLSPDYTLQGFCQIITYNVSPGKHIMDILYKFDHWLPTNAETCLRNFKGK